MPNKAHLAAAGNAPLSASAITGGVVTQAVSGSASTDATLMPIGSHYQVTTSSSNQGMIFPPGNGTTDSFGAGDWGTIFNNTGNTIKVYPPAGFKINGGTATTGSVSLTTLQKALWVCLDGSNFTMLVA